MFFFKGGIVFIFFVLILFVFSFCWFVLIEEYRDDNKIKECDIKCDESDEYGKELVVYF